MMRLLGGLLSLALVACTLGPPLNPQTGRSPQSAAQSLSAKTILSAEFTQQFPATELQSYLTQAQTYADLISRRRQIDFFKIHPNPIGLRLKQGADQAHILSFVGTALERNDLNVELRLLSADATQMNLNYSGPVTLSETQNRIETDPASARSQGGFRFELIQGLPPESFLRPYERHLNRLSQVLRSRYQAQPIEFDDGPLIYAVELNGELQGFVFMNQRNILRLGERKYADVQSVAFVNLEREIAGAYTLVGFNPKTAQAGADLSYQIASIAELGTLVQFGEL